MQNACTSALEHGLGLRGLSARFHRNLLGKGVPPGAMPAAMPAGSFFIASSVSAAAAAAAAAAAVSLCSIDEDLRRSSSCVAGPLAVDAPIGASAGAARVCRLWGRRFSKEVPSPSPSNQTEVTRAGLPAFPPHEVEPDAASGRISWIGSLGNGRTGPTGVALLSRDQTHEKMCTLQGSVVCCFVHNAQYAMLHD